MATQGQVSRIEGTTTRQAAMAGYADLRQAVCACRRHRCYKKCQLRGVAQWLEGVGYRGPYHGVYFAAQFAVGPCLRVRARVGQCGAETELQLVEIRKTLSAGWPIAGKIG